jgi:threonine synthase
MVSRFHLRCISCGSVYDYNEVSCECKKCGDLLAVEYNLEILSSNIADKWRERPLSVWKYRELMPVEDYSKIVTLNEGGTPLYKCSNLASSLGIKNLYVKNEGANPTGSFKDRGMTVGVTKALEFGMKVVACASTGNTSASLAAYASKAGLECVVIVPGGNIALGKVAQALIYGAHLVSIHGNFDEALEIVKRLSKEYPFYLLNSVNAFRLEGQKSIGFETIDQLNEVPDTVVLPVGNAGNVSAIWKGFTELYKLGIIEKLPRMIGIQAAGAAPIVDAMKRGLSEIVPVVSPETVATAIRIGSPASWKKALRALRESKGLAEVVTDQEILDAQSLLARKEGIFVEPASAAPIAGLKKLINDGVIDKDEVVVCVTTGNGLKDTHIIVDRFANAIMEVNADLNDIVNLLKKEHII